jgi:hypothetical protein
MISGEFRKGHFEFNVSSDGEIQYLVLNGYKITPEDADLGKLVHAYFDKIYEGRRRSCRELEEIIYG